MNIYLTNVHLTCIPVKFVFPIQMYELTCLKLASGVPYLYLSLSPKLTFFQENKAISFALGILDCVFKSIFTLQPFYPLLSIFQLSGRWALVLLLTACNSSLSRLSEPTAKRLPFFTRKACSTWYH